MNRRSEPCSRRETLVDLLWHRAEYQANRPGLIFVRDGDGMEEFATYADLHDRARGIAALLQHQGLAGERAVLLYQPGIDYVLAFLGCLYAGTVAVPVFAPRMNRSLERMQAIVASAGAAVMLSTASVLAKLDRKEFEFVLGQRLRWLATDTAAALEAQDWRSPAIRGDCLAFLQFTSGSTGSPKGVMLTHANLLHNSELIHQQLGTTPESQGVSWLPPYHDMGLIGGLLQPLYAGFPCTLMSPAAFLKRPLRWLELITRRKATHSAGPNFAYELCVQRVAPEQRDTLDLSRWRVALNGAEPVRAATIERFSEYFSVCGFRRSSFYPSYGLAEATLIVSGPRVGKGPDTLQVTASELEQGHYRRAPDSDPDARMLVSSGFPALDTRVRIVDPETGVACEPGRLGEMWVASPSVAAGYWGHRQESEQVFRAYVAGDRDGPFLRTGDLGFIQDGQVYVTGRLKDLIIISGRNHYPQDIEATASACHPGLRAAYAAAFSVEDQGEERLIIVHEVERRNVRADPSEFETAIRDAVSREHQLRVHAVGLIRPGSIPLTSSGKIRRHTCRQRMLAGQIEFLNQPTL